MTETNLAGASVTFNGVPATGIVVNGAGTSLTGTTPAGTGAASVPVTTPGGSATIPGGFTYTLQRAYVTNTGSSTTEGRAAHQACEQLNPAGLWPSPVSDLHAAGAGGHRPLRSAI
ncbi:hypothetical protein [Streptomyces lydicamycinicus]|uniref:hypothetical protein n=1 Tax=Streptomyces lydicamycinicus TaxID=1546107 RepID=UPI003C3062EE